MPSAGRPGADIDFEDCLDQLATILQKFGESYEVIIGSDWNADIVNHGNQKRCKMLTQFIEEFNLSATSTSHTFTDAAGKDCSTIDYFLVRQKFADKVSSERLDELYKSTSDHYPVHLIYPCNVNHHLAMDIGQPQTLNPKIPWNKVDIDLFAVQVKEAVTKIPACNESNSEHEIGQTAVQLCNILATAARKSAPQCKTRRINTYKVNTAEANTARIANKQALWEWKLAGKPGDSNNQFCRRRKDTKKELRRQIRIELAKRRDRELETIMSTNRNDQKLFYRLIKRQRSNVEQRISELVVGNQSFRAENILQGWKQHFTSLATPETFENEYTEHFYRDISNIRDVCDRSGYQIPLVCVDDIQKALCKMNSGKSHDIFDTAVEHFRLAGEEVLSELVCITNAIFRKGIVPDVLKQGLITPVYKRKGDKTISTNYRGITVMPVISKLIETILRQHIQKIFQPSQSKFQRGFTALSSPMNCSLLLQEAILDSRERKIPIYISFLDAKAAFDVVSHASLSRKLYVYGVDGELWQLVHSLHENAVSCVKWNGMVSDAFPIKQGLRQGGVLSTDFYKIYINNLLDRIEDSGIGAHIGDIHVAAPTCADDVALISHDPYELQLLINMAFNYSKQEQYKLQPAKSVILEILPKTFPSEASDYKNWFLGNAEMPKVQQTLHMGILRSATKQVTVMVSENISKGRRTAYSLMGAGLHGENGLDPQSSCKILQLYVIPVLVYGLEVILPKKHELELLEQYFKQTLKHMFSIPVTTADPVVYVLSGYLPLEADIHQRALTLFGNICRSPCSIEYKLAQRHLSLSQRSKESWFSSIRRVLAIYSLPSIHDLIANPPKKEVCKWKVRTSVGNYWKKVIVNQAHLYPSLKNFSYECYKPGFLHSLLSTVNPSPRDVMRYSVKIKLATDSYLLQSNRAAFNQQQPDPTCLLCKRGPETKEHFILHCDSSNDIRMPLLRYILHALQPVCHINALNNLTNSQLMQLVLDPGKLVCSGVLPKLPVKVACDIESAARRLCFQLHMRRKKIMETLPTRKRNGL